MFRFVAVLATICCGTFAAADGKIASEGYTSLAQPTTTVSRTWSAPQPIVVPSMIFSSCCCGGQVTFIQGVAISTPAIQSQSWGSNG